MINEEVQSEHQEPVNDPDRTKFLIMDVKSIPDPLKQDGKWAKLVEGHGLVLWDSTLGGHKPQLVDRSDFYEVIDSNQLTAEDREALKGIGVDMDQVAEDFPSVYQTHPEEGLRFVSVKEQEKNILNDIPFLVRTEEIEVADYAVTTEDMAYTMEGDFIGKPMFAHALAHDYIRAEKIEPADRMCMIGYKASTETWYGWCCQDYDSVRHFDKGVLLHKDDELSRMKFDNGLKIPTNFKAVTLNDARRLAIAWARQNYID